MKLGGLRIRHAVDGLVVVLAVVAQVELWAAPVWGRTPALSLAALVGTLPLLVRRRFPFGAPTLVFVALAGMALVDPSALGDDSNLPLAAIVSLMLAMWFAGANDRGEHVIAAVAIGLASIAVVGRSSGADFAVVGEGSDLGLLGVVLIGGGLALAAVTLQRRARRAVALEDRAARLEREREERARTAVVAERARIARDLHDVIAHSVTVMTIQAGAARLLLPAEPERARDAALSVEETGRQALTEMRRLLGVLRADEGEPARAPQPGLGDLNELLGRMRRAGVRVQVELEGGPGVLPPGLDLAAYRIVEQALAHALEHRHASWARVTARYGRQRLELEIANDGRGPSDPDGDGDCLVAMRELVALYGGELEAGRDTGGGYAVHARLPLSSPWPASSSSTAGGSP